MDDRKKDEELPEKREPQNAKERWYDSTSLTYRQVDWFVKILAVVIAVVLVIGIVRGNG